MSVVCKVADLQYAGLSSWIVAKKYKSCQKYFVLWNYHDFCSFSAAWLFYLDWLKSLAKTSSRVLQRLAQESCQDWLKSLPWPAKVLITLLERQPMCLRISKMLVLVERYLLEWKVICSVTMKCLRIRALVFISKALASKRQTVSNPKYNNISLLIYVTIIPVTMV
jgi:hypothetical protein